MLKFPHPKMIDFAEGPLGADDVLPQNGEGPEGIGHLPRLELVHLAARVVRQRRQEVFVVDVGLGKGHGLGGNGLRWNMR